LHNRKRYVVKIDPADTGKYQGPVPFLTNESFMILLYKNSILVQFHPESILTLAGKQLLRNFLLEINPL
jgi:imidazoleglycerol phosphate synthase glutamine amidotransferase subunit HisH